MVGMKGEEDQGAERRGEEMLPKVSCNQGKLGPCLTDSFYVLDTDLCIVGADR